MRRTLYPGPMGIAFALAVAAFVLAYLIQGKTDSDVVTLFCWAIATTSGGFAAWIFIRYLGNRNDEP